MFTLVFLSELWTTFCIFSFWCTQRSSYARTNLHPRCQKRQRLPMPKCGLTFHSRFGTCQLPNYAITCMSSMQVYLSTQKSGSYFLRCCICLYFDCIICILHFHCSSHLAKVFDLFELQRATRWWNCNGRSGWRIQEKRRWPRKWSFE